MQCVLKNSKVYFLIIMYLWRNSADKSQYWHGDCMTYRYCFSHAVLDVWSHTLLHIDQAQTHVIDDECDSQVCHIIARVTFSTQSLHTWSSLVGLFLSRVRLPGTA